MNLITNPAFTETEIAHLEFVLQHEFPKRSIVIEQLNRMKEIDITRDVTPYYWIMEFRPDGVNPGHGPMRPLLSFHVIHEDGAAPSEFMLYDRNGYVFELEIYNADSSAMDLHKIMVGNICIHDSI